MASVVSPVACLRSGEITRIKTTAISDVELTGSFVESVECGGGGVTIAKSVKRFMGQSKRVVGVL